MSNDYAVALNEGLIANQSFVERKRTFHLKFSHLFYLYLYVGFILVAFFNLPYELFFHYSNREVLIGFGVIGGWRYAWWMINVVRSFIFTYYFYPAKKKQAEAKWAAGWRP